MDNQFNTFDVTGGGGELSGYGFPAVHKFDATGFYNWEEDNLPIQDLTHRSNILRQYLGVGTTPSAVTLTVSAGADLALSAQGIFTTIQDALAIVPRRLTFPLLIEICDFGSLGDLILSDIQCEGDGALQITSRQYGMEVSGVTRAVPGTNIGPHQVVSVSGSKGFGPEVWQTLPYSVQASALSATLMNVSSTKLGVNCSSLTDWDRNARVFAQKIPDSQSETQSISFAPFPRGVYQANYGAFDSAYEWHFFQRKAPKGSVVVTNNTTPPTIIDPGFTGQLSTNPYSDQDEETVALDVSPRTKGGSGNSLIEERIALETGSDVVVLAYGAHFNQVKIRNCHNVKLQGICVDSASGSDAGYTADGPVQYLCDTGIDVLNSNVVLEDVAIARCKKTGLKIQNSTVNAAKSLVVYRIYDRTVNKKRLSEGVGISVIDSTLAFDDTSVANSGRSLTSVSKTGIGIHCINSLITGGVKSDIQDLSYPKNGGGLDTRTTKLYSNHNRTGIKLENSILDYDGRLEIFCNLKGLDAVESTVTTVQFSIDDNQNEGIDLTKSKFVYGKYADYFTSGDYGGVSATTGALLPKGAFTADYNGVNVHVKKGSSLIPSPDCSAIPNLDIWGGSFSGTGLNTVGKLPMASHGVVDETLSAPIPAIMVTDNSNAEFVNLGFAGRGSEGFVGGACARADKNSSLTFRGTKTSTTSIGSYGSLNAQNLKNNWTTAATCANDNSKITFTGPTKIGRYGICVLAENNSTMNFEPPCEGNFGWLPSPKKYGLAAAKNQTKLDLHSTRACLVANNKSTVNMIALGGSAVNTADTVDAYALSSGTLYDTFFSSTRHSFVRMFPNGFTENAALTPEVQADYLDLFTRSTMAIDYNNMHYAGTTGGMCVRAVGSSKVNLNMVDFKCGIDASPLSGVCYNYYGAGCEFDNTNDFGAVASPTSDLCASIADLECCTNPCPTTTTPATTTTSTTSTTTTSLTTTSTTTTTTTTSTTLTTLMTTAPWFTSTPATWTPPNMPVTNPNMTQAQQSLDIFDKGIYADSQGDPGAGGDRNYTTDGNIDFTCVGSRIQLWNVADTSRIHASNLLINGLDPSAACITNGWHGPTGRWYNGAACDYYGKFGVAAVALDASEEAWGESTSDGFYNLGIFRIVGSHRGYLKMYGEVDYGGTPITSQYIGGGSPLDQVGGQGYQSMFDQAVAASGMSDPTRHIGLESGSTSGVEPVFGRGLAGTPNEPGVMNGMMTHAPMVQGLGMVWDLGQLHPQFPVPPLHLGWQGYIRNWVDESAASVFANARHSANKKVNLLSIYRSNTLGLRGGEGRDSTLSESPTYGVGVKSLNLFDLDRLL